jgi:hypothetical protein
MADREQINALIKKLSERMGTPEGELRAAVESSDISRLLSRMEPQQARQIESVLGDEEKAKQFLNSPQAKALIKRLMG